jgi:hypothetical protein
VSSATLVANERVQAKLAAGAPVLHLAFGEAGLPVLPSVAEQLAAAAHRNGYGSVAGSPALRAAAAGYYERRGVPTTPEQIVVAPGSKALLFGLLSVLRATSCSPVRAGSATRPRRRSRASASSASRSPRRPGRRRGTYARWIVGGASLRARLAACEEESLSSSA